MHTSTRRTAAVVALWLAMTSESHDYRRVAATDPRIRYEGRVVTDARDRARFAWPRCAMHVRFRGTTLTALLRDVPAGEAGADADAIGVQVDGAATQRVELHPGGYEYTLTAGLPWGEHSVRVMKLTEAEVGTIQVDGVTAPGGLVLAASTAPRRKILAIGDSITAGYGVNGTARECVGAVYNDASRSWVSLAADALGAELQVIAWSGRGLVRNYDPDVRETLIDLFPRAIPTEAGVCADLRGWAPDDVVLNVGTNDAAAPDFDDAAFTSALDAFVGSLHALYPRARFVFAVGPLLSDYYPALDSRSRTRVLQATVAVARAERARGSASVTVMELPTAPAEEGCGCGAHPSAITHARMARQLVEALREAR